jgi:GT2 family glycosyltransferase
VQCLESIDQELDNLPSKDVEIIVVDNASTDDTVVVIRERFPNICVIENTKNVGFAGANNQAIRHSHGKYVLLLNPDTQVRSGALKTLLEFMDGEPKVGLAGAQLLNPDNSLQTSSYPAPTLARELWRLFHFDKIYPYGIYQMNKWSRTEPRPVETLLGACILARREVLEKIGLLDESYFMYSEEIDLCLRARKAGWPIYWVPEAKIVHYGGQSTQQVATEMFVHLYRSKLSYFNKHHGRVSAIAYKLIIFMATLSRLILTPLALFEPAEKRRQHLHLAGNYTRLLIALPGMRFR